MCIRIRLKSLLSRCPDVVEFRKKAIILLNDMPTLRNRMRDCWERGQWTGGGETTPKQEFIYPKLDEVATQPQTKCPVIATSSFDRLPSISASIALPFDLPATFQDIARNNTIKGVETCGILLGERRSIYTSDVYKITTMVIPRQTGTRDTCEALPGAEERILSYALTNNLVCLGWIHTHPTQSCFLSSIDMHTTLPYQQMLESAIAIVVAPTDKQLPIGVWRLTHYGMSKLRQCKLSGFHNHEGKEAFSELVNDISWDTKSGVVVVDQR
jgi:proteasome lid subunit RPN8/RPN11